MKASTLIISILAATGLGLSGVALGQQQEREYQQPPRQQQPSTPEVTDAELEKYAKAQGQIRDIQDKYSSKVRQTDDRQDQQQLQTKANRKMQEAIQEAGLDVQTYNQIAMAIEQDPELRERVEQKIES